MKKQETNGRPSPDVLICHPSPDVLTLRHYQKGFASQAMINLHNHTTWSDGLYTPEQLVKMAVVSGLTHIGIADHFFTVKLAESQSYLDVDEIAAYAADLRRVGDAFGQYIQVLAGIEIHWSPRTNPYLEALWPETDQLDYVLFEYVQNAQWQGGSLESLVDVLPGIRVPVGLAHNHLSRNFGETYTPEELVALLEKHHIFIELSTGPLTCYYRDPAPYSLHLWDALAQSDVRFSIGSDTHDRIDDVAEVSNAHRFLQEHGLLDRLITARWDPGTRTWSDHLW